MNKKTALLRENQIPVSSAECLGMPGGPQPCQIDPDEGSEESQKAKAELPLSVPGCATTQSKADEGLLNLSGKGANLTADSAASTLMAKKPDTMVGHQVRSSNQPAVNDNIAPPMCKEVPGAGDRLFRSLFECHSAINLLIDPETGRIIDANDAAVQFYGWPSEKLKQMNIKQINTLPPEDVQAKMELAELSQCNSFEFSHRLADGSTREVEAFSNRIEISGKKYLLSIIHDISERKKAERLLVQQAEELASAKEKVENEKRLLAAVLESLPVGVAITDLGGASIRKNAAFERIWDGTKPIPPTGDHNQIKAWWDSTDEPVATDQWPMVRALQRHEYTVGQVIRLEGSDGAEVFIINSASPIFDNREILIGCAVTVQDITELKRTERALREKEADFALAQKVGNIGTWRLDVKRNLLTWSDETHRIFGVPKGTPLSYESFLSKVHPDDRAIVDRRWQEALGGTPYDIEHRIEVDGETKWVREKAFLEFDKDGRLAGGFGITEDITQRRLMRETLRRSEERYRVLAETMLQGVIHQDVDGNLIAMNRAAENILGRNRDQLFTGIPERMGRHAIREDGSPFPILEHPAMVALRTGQTVRNIIMGVFNLQIGAYRWLSIDAMPMFAQGSELPSEVYSVFEDITERRQAETALREKERMMRGLINSVDESIYLLGVDGRILAANETTARRLGLTVEEIIGRQWQKLVPANLVIERNKKIEEIYRTGLPVYFEDVRDAISFGHSAYPVRDDNGAITALAVFSRDITNQKMSEAALRKSKQELQALNSNLEQMVERRTLELQETQKQFLHAEKLAAIGKLSASIAHEFNNPLQGIVSVLKGLMKRAIMEEEDRELLEEAIKECDRIKDLIRNLQEFNRPSSGRKRLMDVNKTIDSLLLLYKGDFQGKRISIVCEFAPQLREIEAVPDQIKQVFLNMLINAADACRQRGGVITISTWQEGSNAVAVAIRDTGVGIKPEDIELIFQPFYTTKPEVKGAGLGLSVCYGVIKNHHGDIRVKSQPGYGSTFTVLLPIKQPDPDV